MLPLRFDQIAPVTESGVGNQHIQPVELSESQGGGTLHRVGLCHVRVKWQNCTGQVVFLGFRLQIMQPVQTAGGNGDMVPVTWGGRAVAVVLMLGGIAFFSGVTANLASFLIKRKDKDKETAEMTRLIEEVEGLRKEITRLRPGPAG